MWLQTLGGGINGSIVHEFHICSSSSLKSCKYMNEMQSQREEASQRNVKHYIISLHSFPLTLSACCLILSAIRSGEGGLIIGSLTCSCNKSCFMKIPQDLFSHIRVSIVCFLHSLYCCCSIFAYSFYVYLSLYGSWREK